MTHHSKTFHSGDSDSPHAPSLLRPDIKALLDRFEPGFLEKRLTRQIDHITRYFGKGVGHFHFENIDWISTISEFAFKATGLYRLGYKNFQQIELTENRIEIPNLPVRFHNFRILHLSDMHLDIDPILPDLIIRRLAGASFDLCVITGDFRLLTQGKYERSMADIEKIRPHLDCRHGVYAILGNHDFIEMVPYLEQLDIRMLLNESARIQRDGSSLGLAGVDDPHFYGLHDLDRAVKAIAHEEVKILLAHSPELYKSAHRLGFNVYLAGHTHGGQVCLPGRIPIFLNVSCPRRFAARSWRYESMYGYTSTGAGSSGVPVRFFCPPEITIHTLLPASTDH
ncbi:MAG: metallophosphoesterase [Candidatus Zhuqueibacterota bacterium]